MKLKYEDMPLPSRDFLLEKLNTPEVNIDVEKWCTKDSDKECHICCSPMQNPLNILEMTDQHPFELLCGHYFCRVCIRKWMSQSYGCPMCRQEFFREDAFDPQTENVHIVQDDAGNIMDLRQMSRIYAEATKEDDDAVQLFAMTSIWTMTRARAILYERGEHHVNTAAFRPYESLRYKHRQPRPRTFDRRCTLNSHELLSAIEMWYYILIVRDFNGDAPKDSQGVQPSIVNHPIASVVCTNMIETAEKLHDGITMTPSDLRRTLIKAFMRSDVRRLAKQLARRNELPRGFCTFVEDLREKVVEYYNEQTKKFPPCVTRQETSLRPRLEYLQYKDRRYFW